MNKPLIAITTVALLAMGFLATQSGNEPATAVDPAATPVPPIKQTKTDHSPHPINQVQNSQIRPEPARERRQTQSKPATTSDGAAPLGMPAKAELADRAIRFQAPTSAPIAIAPRRQPPPRDREGYAAQDENRFRSVALSPLSTFGLEVDTASYSNLRRQINQGRVPVPASVRLEEVVNYFDYNFPSPSAGHPIAVMSDYAVAPWNPDHRLAMIGVKAVDTTQTSERGARLTFLLDTSGSMNQPSKLPLLIRSFQTLLANLQPQDQVAIVTYAGSAGLVLPPTPVTQSESIHNALAHLRAGGSTAGGAGIRLAYKIARQQFDPQATNMVILATDGDFNVGASSDGELKAMIEKQRESGVFLSVLGMGSGNYQDAKMQVLSEAGNGVAHYLDSDAEAKRLFSTELTRTLHIAAKDVKVQVEFNPAAVAQYRLLGYESRVLAAEDFRDDRKDSGEIGAGHSVVALYEIIPANGRPAPDIERRYQSSQAAGSRAMELGYVKIRYKQPDADTGIEFGHALTTRAQAIHAASADLQWASVAAEFSMVLSQSKHAGQSSLQSALARARAVAGQDDKRAEFVRLAQRLASMRAAVDQ